MSGVPPPSNPAAGPALPVPPATLIGRAADAAAVAALVTAPAEALGLRETGETPLATTLRTCLQPRAMLLVLDNLEQVVGAAAEIGALLAAAPDLQILATSRVPLRLRGERVYPLPPLARPDPAHLPALAALAEVPAVALFVARAQAVQPAFQFMRPGNPPHPSPFPREGEGATPKRKNLPLKGQAAPTDTALVQSE